MKEKKTRIIIASFMFVFGLGLSFFLVTSLDKLLTTQSVMPLMLSDMLMRIKQPQVFKMFCMLQLLITCAAFLYAVINAKPYQSDIDIIAGSIETPKRMGQNQHGSARWMTEKERDKYFGSYILPKQGDLPSLEKAGVVIGKKDVPEGEKIYYVERDTHALIIGATRSGKSRTSTLQTIGTVGLSGESMIVSDPKGELYQYTKPYLEEQGYRVYTIDFKNPEKSNKYNFLQPMIDFIDANDISRAVDAAWDLVNSLVPEPKQGEPIWTNGEKAVLAAAAMTVVFDNKKGESRKFRNLTNVYAFVSNMCKDEKPEPKINEYMRDKDDSHPAKMLYDAAEIAPSKTRGSFNTGVLATLRLFATPSIYSITNGSEISVKELASGKTALFIILPDEKDTYYSLAALLVSQIYERLVNIADNRGGRLPKRVNFILDEFGNFTKIPAFDAKLTVGGGRGIRFILYLQSFAQLDAKYDKDLSKIIRGNCETWLYLQTEDTETRKELSEKLGKYTASSYQTSSSSQKYSQASSSHSVSLMARELLTPDEIGQIDRPYTLVTSRKRPAIFNSPDLSKWRFNTLFGLGNEVQNTRIRMQREEQLREVRTVVLSDNELWGIWKLYGACPEEYGDVQVDSNY